MNASWPLLLRQVVSIVAFQLATFHTNRKAAHCLFSQEFDISITFYTFISWVLTSVIDPAWHLNTSIWHPEQQIHVMKQRATRKHQNIWLSNSELVSYLPTASEIFLKPRYSNAKWIQHVKIKQFVAHDIISGTLWNYRLLKTVNWCQTSHDSKCARFGARGALSLPRLSVSGQYVCWFVEWNMFWKLDMFVVFCSTKVAHVTCVYKMLNKICK